MLKILGALCIFCTCGYAGMKIAAVYSERTRLFRLLQHGLAFLETEINYSSTPLPLALQKVGSFLKGDGGLVFRQAAFILQTRRGISARAAWEDGVAELRKRVPLTQEEADILRIFGCGLGSSDKEEQLKNLFLARKQLQLAEQAAEESRARYQRMWQYLGFCLGAAVVIVLI